MTSENKILLGKNNEFKLEKQALEHIINGDYSKRPEMDNEGKRIAKDVLAGGLHTWDAWQSFLKLRPEFVHLHDYDPFLHTGWYFARELQNGVITLKIPRQLFSKDAASITMMPDLLFKSGYLWKTLFPRNYSEKDIISTISEALKNISVDESQLDSKMKIIIGYAKTTDPFTAIRIRIQTEDDLIKSAFPSWDQPNTGNNGKPYSPEQSLSFAIAESTIGATGSTFGTSKLLEKGREIDLKKLIEMTPSFLEKRTFPKYSNVADKWREGWKKQVAHIAETASPTAVAEVVIYINDFLISKEPFFLQSTLNRTARDKVLRSMRFINCGVIMQNLNDCFQFLLISDNKSKARNFLDCTKRFLETAVIHTGFLNLLEYKRLLKVLLRGASSHHAKDAIQIVWESFVGSPWRIAGYTELNPYSYFKKNDELGWAVIGGPKLEVPVTTGLIYDWTATNLGETYLISFSKEQRFKIAKEYIHQGLSDKFVEGLLKYFTADDFIFLADEMDSLLNSENISHPPSEVVMIDLLREYDRILLTYRQRIVLEDPDSYQAEIDYGDHSPESFEILKQKHKRSYVISKHEGLFSTIESIAKKWNYKRLELRVNKLKEKMGKERLPLPIKIPSDIRNWKDVKSSTESDIEKFINDPLYKNR